MREARPKLQDALPPNTLRGRLLTSVAWVAAPEPYTLAGIRRLSCGRLFVRFYREGRAHIQTFGGANLAAAMDLFYEKANE